MDRILLSMPVPETALSTVEHQVIGGVKAIVQRMPSGTARFEPGAQIGMWADPEFQAVFRSRMFTVIPARTTAALLQGLVLDSGDAGAEVFLIVGRASSREFSLSAASNQLETGLSKVFRICSAVFTSHLEERVTLAKNGTVLSSRLVVPLDEHQVIFSSGSLWRNLFSHSPTKCIHYDPYY